MNKLQSTLMAIGYIAGYMNLALLTMAVDIYGASGPERGLYSAVSKYSPGPQDQSRSDLDDL